jgi:hypothetical protein
MVGHIEIGIRYYGKTAAVGNEAVYSSFLVIAVPLVPTGSHYGVRTGNFCEHLAGRRINWHFRSVLLGYLRWAAIVPPIIVFCLAAPNNNHVDWDFRLVILSIFLAAVYAGLLFFLVKAPRREALQRKILAQLVHTTVDPAWIPRAECEPVVNNLRHVLESLNVSMDPRAWQLRKPDAEIAPFMYTYARYMDRVDPGNDWDDAARRIWEEMEADAKHAESSPLGRLA